MRAWLGFMDPLRTRLRASSAPRLRRAAPKKGYWAGVDLRQVSGLLGDKGDTLSRTKASGAHWHHAYSGYSPAP